MQVVPDQERCDQYETEHVWKLAFNPGGYKFPYIFWYCSKCRKIEEA